MGKRESGRVKEPVGRVLLWVGAKHGGKTTRASELAQYLQEGGFAVGGILAPSIYREGRLVGFDVVDIGSGGRVPLAVRDESAKGVVPFSYYEGGLKLGAAVLSGLEGAGVDLIIVDEYGPLELKGQGWRRAVDNLLARGRSPLLLVVRRELVDQVAKLYERHRPLRFESADSGGIKKLAALITRRRVAGGRPGVV